MMGRLEAAVDGLPEKEPRFAFTAGEVLIGPGGASLSVDGKTARSNWSATSIGATSALDAPATCRPPTPSAKWSGMAKPAV